MPMWKAILLILAVLTAAFILYEAGSAVGAMWITSSGAVLIHKAMYS